MSIMKAKRPGARRVALYGVLGALALSLSALEGLLTPQLVFLPPGAKPGLANVALMFAFERLGPPGGLYIAVLKALFALVTRGGTAALMSASGGALSLAAIWLLRGLCAGRVGEIGVGVASACAHNLGQLAAACLLTGTRALALYAPFLLLFGLVAGFATGTIIKLLMPALGGRDESGAPRREKGATDAKNR